MSTEQAWQSKEAADRYSRVADMLVPNRREILSIIARVATLFAPEPPRVLDLGCGYGDVTAAVLERVPQACVCMVDFSEEMIHRGVGRFQGNKDIQILSHNLNEGLPEQLRPQEFDAVVSCFALHHVEFERRVPLYAQVREVLRPSGVFVNGDRFREHSPSLHTWVFDGWVTWMQQQIQGKMGKERTFEEVKAHQVASDERLGDKPGTIWATQHDLQQVGFTYVDCLFKAHQLAVIAATNR